MAHKYFRSGNTDEALTDSATDVRELLGSGITTNRDLWITMIWVYNSHNTNDGVVTLWDQAEGVAVAANEKFSFPAPAATVTIIELPNPGIQFLTNCCVAISAGTVAVYQAGGAGYEVGGS